MHIFKIFLKAVVCLICVVVLFVVLAFISITRNPIGKHVRQLDKNYFNVYTQEKTAEEKARSKKQLDTLAQTGSGAGGNFGRSLKEATEDNEKEKENKDLYNAIKQAKDKGLAIDLSGADLFLTDLQNIDLSGANLSQANLMGARLQKANLRSAHLKGANLSLAQLQEVNLQGADLTGAELGRTQLTLAHLTNANMHEAILSYTNLSEANMSNVDLTNAVIVSCLTADTQFIGADFRGARILNTFSKRANLTEAHFDGLIVRALNSLTLWLLGKWQDIKDTIENRREQKAM